MNKLPANLITIIFYAFACTIFSGMAIQASAQTGVQADAERNHPQAVAADPADVIRVAIGEVMSAMRNNEKLYKDNPDEFQEIVGKIALPYLSIPHMAQLSMGKNWRGMSDEQRVTIIKEYQTYLIRSYTNTLFLYRYTKPEVINRTDNGDNKTVLKVSVKNELGNVISLFIRLEKNDNHWQILDVSVEGVSLVITSRGQFDDEISKKGIDGFIQSFSEQNKKATPGDKH